VLNQLVVNILEMILMDDFDENHMLVLEVLMV
jgi:hypothetical protein